MDPIQQLIDEHDNILEILDILKLNIEDLESGREISFEIFEKIINFIKIYVDNLHHGKEEKILFSSIKENKIHINQGLIDEIESEHVIGRDLVHKMNVELKKIQENKSSDFQKLVSFSRDYFFLLIQHIEKENLILFPEINENLSAEHRLDIEKNFEYVEKNEIGLELINQQLQFLDSQKQQKKI
ncbi:MAG: hemerythrin domain-containing protein [Candidatus Hodarchaeales archaeon]|jgi:hemerythrin-like domain-containing protein